MFNFINENISRNGKLFIYDHFWQSWLTKMRRKFYKQTESGFLNTFLLIPYADHVIFDEIEFID